MYDPVVGRFLSEDPLEFDAGDPNLSRYVGNQPNMVTDPSGLAPPAAEDRSLDYVENHRGGYGALASTDRGYQPAPTAKPHNYIDTGVKVAQTYCKGAYLFNSNRAGFPTHGFIIIDGKGYGYFLTQGNSLWGPGMLRSDDLVTYKPYSEEMTTGEYYFLANPIVIDAAEHDVDKYRSFVKAFIAMRTKNPGTYVPGARDCHEFVNQTHLDALWLSRNDSTKQYFFDSTGTEWFYNNHNYIGPADIFSTHQSNTLPAVGPSDYSAQMLMRLKKP